MTWGTVRLDAIARRVKRTLEPNLLGDRLVDHYTIPHLEATGSPEVLPAVEIRSAKQLLAGGEVMVSRLNPRKSRVVAVPFSSRVALASGEFVVMRPHGIEPRFLTYLLLSEPVRQHLDARVQSVTRSHQRVRPEVIMQLKWDVPDRLGQRAIANYLDTETGRIDALISKKRRMIDLLTERRQAVTTTAMTRDVALSEKAALRHFVTCLDGQRVPLNATERSENPGDYPYWGANGVADSVGDFLFDEELVLLGEDGAPFDDQRRDVAFYVNGRIWVNNHIHVLKPNAGTDPRYLTYALNAADWMPLVSGSTRLKLTQDDMMRVRIPYLALDEQRAVVRYLDIATGRIDGLISKTHRMIVLLVERRQALITAAVTGELAIPAVAARLR